MSKKRSRKTLRPISVTLTPDLIELCAAISEANMDTYMAKMINEISDQGGRLVIDTYKGRVQVSCFFSFPAGDAEDVVVSGLGMVATDALISVYTKLHTVLDWELEDDDINDEEITFNFG